MSNESQDKKDTVPDVPSAKSSELPRVETQYLPDVPAANPNDVALPASTPAATTQPSLRRMQRALLPAPPAQRGRGVQVILVLLGLAIIWEVAMLIRTSLVDREDQVTLRGQPEPSASVQISAASTHTAVTISSAPNATERNAATSPQAPSELVPPAASPTDEPATVTRSSSAPASAPRAPVAAQDQASLRQETNVRPKQESLEAPSPASSSKSPSKVLFPPQ